MSITLLLQDKGGDPVRAEVVDDRGEKIPVEVEDTEARLRAAFSFDTARFGAVLSLSEVAAAAHEVPGVVAVDIDRFYRTTPPQAALIAHRRLFSEVGRFEAGVLLPAELLTLDPAPFDRLEEMT